TSYAYSVDRGLNFDAYWRSVSLGPSLFILVFRENLIEGDPGFAPRPMLRGSSSSVVVQQDSLLDLGYLLPSWDLQIHILGTSNMFSIEGGPFDYEGIIGFPLPSDIPE
ncbi:hypothetical protein MKX01_013813, partial [Papaver californicum]